MKVGKELTSGLKSFAVALKCNLLLDPVLIRMIIKLNGEAARASSSCCLPIKGLTKHKKTFTITDDAQRLLK
jgi:hypothetical protein